MGDRVKNYWTDEDQYFAGVVGEINEDVGHGFNFGDGDCKTLDMSVEK